MMRLQRLDLKRFGHFTDTSLEFGEAVPGRTDFHVVYGPNEAGKTTLMEGYLRLLYGFLPQNEPYGFRHQRKNLAVSGLLDINDQTLFLERSPAKNSPLLDAHGNGVPETVLGAALGGLSPKNYRKLLCLDDATIETGGQEITNSEGEIGRLLFSAAAGISDLSTVLDDARQKADALYRKNARLTRFAEVKKAFEDIRTRIQEADIPAETWRARRQALEAARQEEASATGARAALYAEKVHIETRLRALPILEAIDVLDQELAPLEHYPESLDLDPEELVRLLSERTALEDRTAHLAREQARLAGELEAAARVPRYPGLADALKGLQDLHSRFQTADSDLPRRRQEQKDLHAERLHHARDLGIEGEGDPAFLVVSEARLSELDQARKDVQDARSESVREQKSLDEQDSHLDRLRQKIAGLQEVCEPGAREIAEVLERFDTHALERDHAVAVADLTSARGRLARALAALSRGSQTFSHVPETPVTAGEVSALVSALGRLDQARETLLARKNEIRTECEVLDTRAGALKTTAGLVSDDAVQAARETRAALWAAHRAALTAQTADAFEEGMQALDRLVDQQLLRATETGQLREVEQELREKTVRAAGLDRSLEHAGAERAALRSRLDGILADAGLTVRLEPDGALVWFQALETAREAAGTLEQARALHAPVRTRVRALLADLGAVTGETGEAENLVDLLHRARGIAERYTARVRTLDQERMRLRENEEARQGMEHRLASVREREEQALARWTALVDSLFQGRVRADVLLRSLDPLRSLREGDGLYRQTLQRIQGMVHDQEAFAREVRTLATRHGIPDGGSPVEVFGLLADRAREAADAEERTRNQGEALAGVQANQAETDRQRHAIAARIQELGSRFDSSIPVATLDDLRSAVAATHRAIEKRAGRSRLEREVCALLECRDTDTVRACLADVRLSTLQTRLLEVKAGVEGAEKRYTAAVEARVGADAALKAVTGEADVALLVERRKTLELELEAIAFEYLEWQIGLRLADEAIRRYRDRHRSGMLEATERAFVELTNGAYTRLQTSPEGGAEILMAVDATGATKRAEDLSKGTRFQLYLALRAAAYEQMAAAGTILPFFCDDIFETFDEGRTRAACHLMARIGRTGQAVYLTHHRHVVDLAQEVCGADVQIHTL